MENKMTNTTPIRDLWNAMGDAGIQPYTIGYIGDWKRFRYTGVNGEGAWLLKDDALHIVKGHAEEWLRGRGWTWVSMEGDLYAGMQVWAIGHDHGRYTANSLHEAILAEVGRQPND